MLGFALIDWLIEMKILFLLNGLRVGASTAKGKDDAALSFNIIHMNDIHSHFDQVNMYNRWFENVTGFPS